VERRPTTSPGCRGLCATPAERFEQRGTAARRSDSSTAGGVDEYGSTKEELYERAKKLDVSGRSSMTKAELARAIARKQ
jgi:hypothetical protein